MNNHVRSTDTRDASDPNRFQHYTNSELFEKLHHIDKRLKEAESQEADKQEEALADRLTSMGAYFVTLSFAAYGMSLALPESSFGPLSVLGGVIGLVLIWIGMLKARRLAMSRQSLRKRP